MPEGFMCQGWMAKQKIKLNLFKSRSGTEQIQEKKKSNKNDSERPTKWLA